MTKTGPKKAIAPITMADAEVRLSEVRFSLHRRLPFFGHLLTSVPTVIVDKPDITAWATNEGRFGRIFVGQEFIAALSRDELSAIMMHEVLHLALGAFSRLKHRNPKLWNIAHDYAINLIIEEFRTQASSPGVAWPRDYPPLLDKRFSGMTAEAIYDLLLSEAQAPDGGGGASGPGGDGQPGFSDATDIVVVEEHSEEAMAQQERAFKNLLAEAVQVHLARGAGKLPGALTEAVDARLRVHVPWVTQFVHKVEGRLHGGGRSYARPSRRSEAMGVILPGRGKKRPLIAIVADTSGSVSRSELTEFFGVVREVSETNDGDIRLLQVDATIQSDEVVEDFDVLLDAQGKVGVRGRGGTCFDEVPARLQDPSFDLPNLAILLTDGDPTSWPDHDAWPCPVVVVTTRTAPPDPYEWVRLEGPGA